MTPVAVRVVDLHGVGASQEGGRGWCSVDAHVLDRVLEGDHRDDLPVVVVVCHVVQSPVLGVVVVARLQHQVAVLGGHFHGPLAPEALAPAVVDVSPGVLGVAQLRGGSVVADPVGRVVVLVLVVGAS